MSEDYICLNKPKLYKLLILSSIYILILTASNRINNKKPDVIIYNVVVWIPWLLIWYVITRNNKNIWPVSICMFGYLILINTQTVIFNIKTNTKEEKEFFSSLLIFLYIICLILWVLIQIFARSSYGSLATIFIIVSTISHLLFSKTIAWQDRNNIIDGPGYMFVTVAWICMCLSVSIIDCK